MVSSTISSLMSADAEDASRSTARSASSTMTSA
jgi:hypothetical protein